MQNPPALKQERFSAGGFLRAQEKLPGGWLGPWGSLFVYCWLSMAVSQASAWA